MLKTLKIKLERILERNFTKQQLLRPHTCTQVEVQTLGKKEKEKTEGAEMKFVRRTQGYSQTRKEMKTLKEN